jgi:hypothetical protein
MYYFTYLTTYFFKAHNNFRIQFVSGRLASWIWIRYKDPKRNVYGSTTLFRKISWTYILNFIKNNV